jgi:hypothetical protein
MRKIFFNYAIIGILGALIFGCERNEINSDGKVDLYLLDTYTKIENSFQIDEATIKTQASPLINYSDFISYDSSNYTFELTEKAKNVIKNLEHSVFGVAFTIKANGELIYSGYFWPSYSSATCDWIVIDPLTTIIGNKITVKLGYPGLNQGQTISDKRNDNRIIQIFERDNKLKG